MTKAVLGPNIERLPCKKITMLNGTGTKSMLEKMDLSEINVNILGDECYFKF